MQITSEGVKIGHPDMVADSIAANIIAAIINEEHKMCMDIHCMPHCGIEVFLGKGLCVVGGEVSTRVYIDIEKAHQVFIETSAKHKEAFKNFEEKIERNQIE